jgi:serine/threonine-protein kinase
MGVVFEAEDDEGRTTALKLLRTEKAGNETYVADFINEAKATGSVIHENVVTVLGHGESDGIHWIEMEFVDGPPLNRFLKDRGRLPWRWGTKIIIQMARALSRAHEMGFVHRDVKPDNVLLFKDGRARLTDFGIVKDIGSLKGYLLKGRKVGTAAYASPEQCLDKRLSTATDMYSLGATFFHIVCGRPPFLGESHSKVMRQHVTRNPPSPSDLVDDIPKATSNTILRMLAKKQTDRYESMDRLLTDLVAALRGRVAIDEGGPKANLKNVGHLKRGRRSAEEVRKEPRIPAELLLVAGLLGVVLVLVVLMLIR